jgi:oxygen-dependent protoporphyrinogen oxidase
MVPQLAELASGHRSLLLGARTTWRRRPPATVPTFYAPTEGMESLAGATRAAAERGGASIHTRAAVSVIEQDGTLWRVDGDPFDAVVLAIPAPGAAPLLVDAHPDLAAGLAGLGQAGVVIVTIAVSSWPERFRGHSGYLVPKAAQRLVTAVSFGTRKWAHWQGVGEILRISLGRDGLDVMDRSDDELADAATTEVGQHLGFDLQPVAVRVSRWPAAFPQYRPGHRGWLSAIAGATPPRLFLTGASYRGIGVPACISDAEATAAAVVDAVSRAKNM